MRRLSSRPALGERGAAVVFFAIVLVALLGMTAFTIDFGRIWSERRQLQTGADAAALAIAQDCVGGCGAGYDEYAVAKPLADANANDGAAGVRSIDIDQANRQVTVVTETETPGGGDVFEMALAGIIGFDGLTVASGATVGWGAPSNLSTVPLIFSVCEWQIFGEPGYVEEGGSLHHADAFFNGELTSPSYPYRNKFSTIYFHSGAPECHSNSSGHDVPGGFGWLNYNASTCSVTHGVGSWVKVDTGNNQKCTNQQWQQRLGTVVVLPIFDDTTGTGNNAQYRVSGYAAYYLTGYKFSGNGPNSLITGNPPCTGSERCVQGYFLGDWVVTDEDLGDGGADYGVVVIRFTN